jgi:hypothetical protein
MSEEDELWELVLADHYDAEFDPIVIHIPWWAYLRTMWNLFWSCILHPLSETTIDLSTGRVLYHR